MQIFRSFAFGIKNTTETLKVRKKIIKMSSKRVLCVAEKNDAAKNISAILSQNRAVRREGRSRFNKLYCFDKDFQVL